MRASVEERLSAIAQPASGSEIKALKLFSRELCAEHIDTLYGGRL
jgi:hypothetical protein